MQRINKEMEEVLMEERQHNSKRHSERCVENETLRTELPNEKARNEEFNRRIRY
jgi:hypothetical protein